MAMLVPRLRYRIKKRGVKGFSFVRMTLDRSRHAALNDIPVFSSEEASMYGAEAVITPDFDVEIR